MSSCDLVVLGDGVAGHAAAITAAKLGLETYLVALPGPEERAIPETLAPVAVPILADLGIGAEMLNASFPRIRLRMSRWGIGPARETAMTVGSSFLLGKRRLRQLLQAAAHQVGVQFMQARSLHAARDVGARMELLLRSGANGLVVQLVPRFAIDATGRASFLAHACGVRRRVLDTLVSFWAEGPRARDGPPTVSVVTVSDGWLFCAPGETGRTMVGYFTVGSHLGRKPTVDGIRQRLATAPELGETSDSSVTWGRAAVLTRNSASTILSAPGGMRWLACGDALQTIDPIASSGLYMALQQGTAAAHAAEATLCGERDARNRYGRAALAEFEVILERRREYYGQSMR